MRADRLLIEVIVISRPCVSYPKECYLPLVTRGPPSLRGGGVGGGGGGGGETKILRKRNVLYSHNMKLLSFKSSST